MCTHTLSIIERLTVNLTAQGATLAPPPRSHPDLSNPVRVNLLFFFPCVHAIIVAVKL